METPTKPVVIYDGTCGICAGNQKWLHRLDWLKKFDDMPYQAPDLTRIFPRLNLEECGKAMHVVFPNGKIYRGADAMRHVFLRMPVTFPMGAIASIPPMPWVLRKLYPVLARNRYRIGGTCEIPGHKTT